jgi:nitrite reductase (NADH) small subunit
MGILIHALASEFYTKTLFSFQTSLDVNPEKPSAFQTVCHVGDITDGEARMFRVNGKMIGVYYIDDTYFALDDTCPHAGASLAHGIVDGDHVACRIHHWRFSIRDGTYLDEDKPQCNLKTYATRVHGREVQVLVTAIDSPLQDG